MMISWRVETLHHELLKNPEAIIAYTDIRCFGPISFYVGLNRLEGSLFDRLVSFFLGGRGSCASPRVGALLDSPGFQLSDRSI